MVCVENLLLCCNGVDNGTGVFFIGVVGIVVLDLGDILDISVLSIVDSLVLIRISAVLGVAWSGVNLSFSASFTLVSVNLVLFVFKDSTFSAEYPLIGC